MTHVLSLASAALIAGVTVVDGSFLVRGLLPGTKAAPVVTATMPAVIASRPRRTDVAKSEARPDRRCPMIVVNGNPKLDAAFAKPAPTHPTFAIKSVPPACTAK